jgi:3-oxoacyl-[acyl-carrier protein] reductase
MTSQPSLAGRVALVTGSSRNIGRAIALALADDGAAVMVNARAAGDAARGVVAEIESHGGRAVFHAADVSRPHEAAALVAATITAFGRLDILINNAAVRRERPFAELDFAEWKDILGVTLDGAFLCSRAALRHLVASGQGTIVNIGGLSAHTGSAGRAHVVAAKAGLVGLTRALAHDLAPHKITVNCVSPGLIDTARDATLPRPAHHAAHVPLVGRRGEAREVAALVRFLCGPGGRYITGQTIHVNGGAYLGG